jgi:hypothetical protein
VKNRFLLLVALASLAAVGLGLRPAPKGQCQLTMTPVFQSGDEQVWQLTIETRAPTKYRVWSAGAWGGGDLPGYTVLKKQGSTGCEAKVWLVFSHIAPSSNGPAFVKTILQGGGATVSQTREIPKPSKLRGIVRETTPRNAETHPLNAPLKIGGSEGQEIWLVVGAQADEWKAK